MLDNILTDPSSTLTDVDTWTGSDELEHKSIDFNDVFIYYSARTSEYTNLKTFISKSEHVLPNLKQEFNFIYIDGDHTEKVVYQDAIQSWELLDSGGIIAFDDYLWGEGIDPQLTPKPAIDRFLAEKQGEYELLTQEYQVWLLKK